MTTPNQSFTFNAYQSNLAGPLLAGLTTVALDFIPAGLGVPAYLVIDPDVPASREYIKVLSYTGNTIDSMERNLEGSAGDVDHLVGAVIRAVYTMQALDDTFLDIEANTTAQTAHINDSGDPHAAAGYIKEVETDVLYLRLDGTSPMAAAIDMANFPINQLATPTVDDDAATKKYVDDQDGLYLLLTGGTLTGQLTGTTAVFTGTVVADNLNVASTFLHFLSVGTVAVRKNNVNMIQMEDEVTVRFPLGRLELNGLIVRNTGGIFQVPAVDANTSGSGPNMVITGASGGIVKSTSARKYKSNIQAAPQLADLTLEPVTFHHDGDGSNYIGFIADDMPVEEAIVRDVDGDVDNYDVRAVVAILAAKVNRLESV